MAYALLLLLNATDCSPIADVKSRSPQASQTTASDDAGSDDAERDADCHDDSDCPVSSSCASVRCARGVCLTSARPAGMALPAEQQVAGDCRRIVCDGRGLEKNEPDDHDSAASDGNPCHANVCENGMSSAAGRVDGTTCNDSGIVRQVYARCVSTARSAPPPRTARCTRSAAPTARRAAKTRACRRRARPATPAESATTAYARRASSALRAWSKACAKSAASRAATARASAKPSRRPATAAAATTAATRCFAWRACARRRANQGRAHRPANLARPVNYSTGLDALATGVAAYGRRRSVSSYVQDTAASALDDASTGTLGQQFVVPVNAVALRFNLCGGRRTRAVLVDGTTELYSATPNDDDSLKVPQNWDLTPYRGKMLRLFVEDTVRTAPYGYIGISGVDVITSYNGP